MAYERSESARENFGEFIHQFLPETKTLIRKLERILIKLYRQNGHGDTSLIAFSHSTNTLGKGMNPIILPPAMGK